jgi:hypothetical protein
MVADAFDGLSFSRFGLVEKEKPGRAACEHLSTPRSNINSDRKHAQTAWPLLSRLLQGPVARLQCAWPNSIAKVCVRRLCGRALVKRAFSHFCNLI